LEQQKAHHSDQGGGLSHGTLNNITGASRTLRVLARLLAYPDAQLRADLSDMREALRG
jgi:hypothetical protein